MAGEEGDRVIDLAMGDGNAGIGKPADARGDARHDAEWDPMFNKRQRLFAATAEDEGVAALEAQHPVAGTRQFDQPQRDVALFRRRFAAAFARELEHGARPRELEAILVDQRIMHDHIRLAQRIGRMQGQETGITGTGTNEPDRTFLERRQSGKEVVDHSCCPPCIPAPLAGAPNSICEEPDSILEQTRTKD